MRLFDLHCDTLDAAVKTGCGIRCSRAAIDLDRGGGFSPWVQTFAAWLPDAQTPGEEARQHCQAMLDAAARWEAEEPEHFHVWRTGPFPDPLPSGCLAVLAVENGGLLEGVPNLWPWLSGVGVKLMTLTWNGDNPWASGCFGRPDGGLTPAGLAALRQMERHGILVDAAHLNAVSFWQTAAAVQRPFLVSHTASAAVHPHPRNLTDEQFAAVRDAGGLVGLDLYDGHLGGEGMDRFEAHLRHFLSLGGEETVCIGTDFDGIPLPEGCRGIQDLQRLADGLHGRGYSPALLDRLFYRNARSFFRRQFGTERTDSACPGPAENP